MSSIKRSWTSTKKDTKPMRRSYIKKGDQTTSGATVTQGIEGVRHHGMTLAFLGAEVYCPRCKSTGHLVGSGPRFGHTWMRKQPVLHDDLAICECEPTPRVIASQHTMFETYEAADLAKMGFAPNGDALSRAASIIPAAPPSAHSDDYAAPTPAPVDDVSVDCSYLDGSKSRIDAPTDFYTKRNTVQLSPGKPVQADFRSGGLAPATEYDATVNGQTIPIIASIQKLPANTALAEPSQIAEALGKLPSQHLPNINRVTTDAAANPVLVKRGNTLRGTRPCAIPRAISIL
jgi:hypothetical protein